MLIPNRYKKNEKKCLLSSITMLQCYYLFNLLLHPRKKNEKKMKKIIQYCYNTYMKKQKLFHNVRGSKPPLEALRFYSLLA